jgi:LAO/AO transport system kinase
MIFFEYFNKAVGQMSLDSTEGLIRGFQDGQTRALARVISRLENEDPERDELIKNIYPLTGRASVLGVTGSPGAGKSSLVDRVTHFLRKRGDTVAVVAVDPTSPFTGGALLGDRIRMQEHATDSGVFIRSMGTRGSLGGLARNTREVVKAMDAFGFNWVIVETVGVGQAELDIMNVADITLVVLTPGAGDSIQTIKAGIMEIADLFVVNKADLPGADRVVTEVGMMLDLKTHKLEWRPPVIQVSALSDMGVAELLEEIKKYIEFLHEKGLLDKKRRDKAKSEVLEIVDYQWQKLVKKHLTLPGGINELLEKVARKESDPYTAASCILERVIGGVISK